VESLWRCELKKVRVTVRKQIGSRKILLLFAEYKFADVSL
jgi:hypothetical protein